MEAIIGYIVIGIIIGIITGFITEHTHSTLIPIISFIGTVAFVSPGCILGWIAGTVIGIYMVE